MKLKVIFPSMRKLLAKASDAQSLDGIASDGESAYPQARNLDRADGERKQGFGSARCCSQRASRGDADPRDFPFELDA